MKEKRGFIMVRNVDLIDWEDFKEFAKEQIPEAKLGPLLSLVMREYVARHKKP